MRAPRRLLPLSIAVACTACSEPAGAELTARIEMWPVDEDSDTFARAANALASDETANATGVDVQAPLPSVLDEGPGELQKVFAPSSDAMTDALERLTVFPEPEHAFVGNCADTRETERRRCELLYVDRSDALVLGHGTRVQKTRTDLGNYVVSLKLNDSQARAWADFTRRHVGDRVAIAVNGDVVSSPVIAEPISGGELQITPGPAEANYVDRLIADLTAPEQRKGAPVTPAPKSAR